MEKNKLSDFIEKYGDGIHGTPNYSKSGDYYFVNGNNLIDGEITINKDTQKIDCSEYERIKRPLTDKTILLSINGTLGRIAEYSNEKIALGKSVCYINAKTTENKYFIKTILSTKEFQKYIQTVAHGSTIKNLAPSQVNDYEFSFPDYIDKEKYSQLFKTIDDRIKNCNKIMRGLNKTINSIFDYWFLQYEFPNDSELSYIKNGGKVQYNEELDMDIPIEWSSTSIGNIIEENPKSTIQVNATDKDGNYPFFTSGESILKNKNYLVDGHNIFLNTGGLADVKFYSGKASYSSDTWSIRAKKEYTDYLYIYLYRIKEKINNHYFEGSTLKHLQKNAFKKINIILPSEKIVVKFNKIVSPILDEVSSYQLQINILNGLRNFLMDSIMSGQATIN